MGKKIYTIEQKCSECKQVIEEHNKKNKSRTIKSWIAICLQCFNTFKKKEEHEI